MEAHVRRILTPLCSFPLFSAGVNNPEFPLLVSAILFSCFQSHFTFASRESEMFHVKEGHVVLESIAEASNNNAHFSKYLLWVRAAQEAAVRGESTAASRITLF